MLKWCPKPFTGDQEPDRTAVDGRPVFESGLSSETVNPVAMPPNGAGFAKDPRLAGNTSLWDLLNSKERESLLDAARTDLQEEFMARENELRESHRTEMAQVREDLESRLDKWSREFTNGLVRERQTMAVDAAGLAVALAGKIIRDTVAVDQDFVIRTLETALFKAQDSHPLTAILHPDDAEYLVQNPGLMSRLRIDKVVPDRRMEKGGCRVRAGSKEWDATLTRQLDTLAAIVEETLAANENTLVTEPGDTHDPGLE